MNIPKYKKPEVSEKSPKIYSPMGLQQANLEKYGELTMEQRGEMAAKQVKRDPKGADQLIKYLKGKKGF